MPISSSPIRIFSTDLDGTLLGNPEATQRFTSMWNSLPSAARPLLVYNTGRTVENTLALVTARSMAMPDIIIGGVGTELYAPLLPRGDEFCARFGTGWDLAAVEQIVAAHSAATRQPPESLHPYKSSWLWPRASLYQLRTLEQRLTQAGLKVTVVYSCDHFLDVLPAAADKGKALRWLCERLDVPLRSVLVAGDTGNDSSMFLLEGVRGIVVENALPELFAAIVGREKYASRAVFAEGVIDGLVYFGVFPSRSFSYFGSR